METIDILLGLVGLVLGLALICPILPFVLGPINVLFSFVEENTAKIKVRGRSFSQAIAQKSGSEVIDSNKKLADAQNWHQRKVNNGEQFENCEWMSVAPPDWWDVVPMEAILPANRRKINHLEQLTGARFVGVPPFRRIFTYKFDWVDYHKEEGEDKEKPIFHEKRLDYIFLKDAVYYGLVIELETSDQLKVDAEYLITIQVVNPFKALFKVHRWLDAVHNLVSQRLRQYVGTRTYEQLVQKEGESNNKGFSRGIRKLRKEILVDYGVWLVRADLLSVELSGVAAAKYQEAATAAYLADAKAVATERDGEAQANVITSIGKARADALSAQIDAFKKDPDAAKATLQAEVGRTMGVGAVVKTITAGVVEAMKETKTPPANSGGTP